jgi:hypothetical protein
MGPGGACARSRASRSCHRRCWRRWLRHRLRATAYSHGIGSSAGTSSVRRQAISRVCATRSSASGLEDSIQAHLTIVFAALAVSREAQARAGLGISRILKVLRPLRSATITIGAQQLTAQPRIPAEARALLNDLGWSGH